MNGLKKPDRKKILIIQKLHMPQEIEYRMYQFERDRLSSKPVVRFFQRLFGDGF